MDTTPSVDATLANARAARFRALHVPGTPMVLPNAWDVASARAIERAGAPVIATSSAALANGLGYPDGQALPLEELNAVVRRIVALVDVPVTVDVEAGYGDSPAAAAESVKHVMEAGAIGINIEDGTASPDLLVEKIRAIRAVARERGRDLFINARTDVFLRGLVADADALDETCHRLERYRDAGADGAFVPNLLDPTAIAAVVARTPMPLNVMVRKGAPPVATLAAAGVARVSLGGAVFHACLSLAQRIAAEVLGAGTYRQLYDGVELSYGGANELFTPRRG